jgi:trk system potassium uptake protein TrkA
MNIIIMGCGRVGEQLARLMISEGHQVAVIDQDANALARLGPDFKGRAVRGIGFDRDVLIKAGIQEADAFAATSSSDNANIIATRIARNVFGVPRVVTRLYDPRRAEIYKRLGLMTISSTTWGAERIRELLTHSELDPTFSFGNGEVTLLSLETPAQLVGRVVRNITVPGEVNVAAIVRDGRAFMPIGGTEFQNRDIIHFIILSASMERFKNMVGLGEGG